MVSRIETAQLPVMPSATTKDIKPLLRRSNLSGTIRKFEDANIDSDSISIPSSPRKRARVTFNPTVEEKVLEEYSRSLDSVRREVKLALDAHARGSSTAYDGLKAVFTTQRGEDEDGLSNEEMRAYVIAFTSHASLLNRSCHSLVKVILDYQWMGREESFVRSYVHFLGSLASAQGAYVASILQMLADYFLRIRSENSHLPGCPHVPRDQLVSRVHAAMKYLLNLIPSASNTLSPLLSSRFPSEDDNRTTHIQYVKNLIRLIDYAPELKSDVLALITDRLVKIDVQMQTDLEDLDDDITTAVVQALSMTPVEQAIEEEEDSDSDADSDLSDDEIPLETKRVKELKGRVEKMDAMMDILFALYEPAFINPDSSAALSIFDTLLGHFQNLIVPTYSSRHTQFLLFHYAQKSDDLVDRFAGTCVELAFDRSRPAILQQSAAAYLASFMARGKHVKPEVVRTVFELFGNELAAILIREEDGCRGPNLQRYATYYAMTQALLYIFCFRWRDLIEDSELEEEDDPIAFINQDFTWCPGVKETITRNIYSKLNPLKVCCPPIVAEFAKIAKHLQFMYIYPLLAQNERFQLSQFSGTSQRDIIRDSGISGRKESWHQLDAQFPFDPYQLPMSKQWIDPDYNEWRGLPGLVEDDDDDESDDDGDNFVSDDEEDHTATDDEDDE